MVARPAGFQNAASPVPPSATAAWPSAVALAPTGTRRNAAPPLLGSLCWATAGEASRSNAGKRLEALRLIDQHDWDIVLDSVDEAAPVTDQLFFWLGPMLQ